MELTCGSALLMEQSTGTILYEHNSHEQFRPASVTKVMTLLLIMEALNDGKIFLTDEVGCSDYAASMGGSQIWLDQTEKLTVDEMIKAICIVSANDCCVAMAEYICGSEEQFVEQMNKKAQELGMKDTCFKNCNGLDTDGHLTSSYDIALMSREIMTKYPQITKYTTIWMDTLRDGKSSLVSTNKLIRNYSGATGLKTGSTSLALFNISATATRNNLSLIAVIMHAETGAVRFDEAKKLLDYGFSNFEYYTCIEQNTVIGKVQINKGVKSNLDLTSESKFGLIIPKGSSKSIVTTINIPEMANATINKGDIIGNITYTLNDEVIGKVNVIASETIKKLNVGNMLAYLYKNWFNLLRKS